MSSAFGIDAYERPHKSSKSANRVEAAHGDQTKSVIPRRTFRWRTGSRLAAIRGSETFWQTDKKRRPPGGARAADDGPTRAR
ncbi:hypothetical protein EVAR_94255_1 [Eumeta japonica]|uniref:Uncharacterized protein n=1 Tax=Eumeta variegata TaxID=151549 RepID=A0A4C1SUH6_EUMVA|nr:hypothetical protein EVAR_94255_1 [Eumeta japonica]